MFKKIFSKSKPREDFRFVDRESIHTRLQSRYVHASLNTKQERLTSSLDEAIYLVEESQDYRNFSGADTTESFLTFINRVTREDVLVAEIEEPAFVSSSLGIFSDSKIYSAAIASVLKSYQLDVRYFNHPNTFTSERYTLFDQIDAWIIFLSDEEESDFLERFLARYLDKPALFLFSKLEKDAFNRQIDQFLKKTSVT